jgi:hypothetical protein
MASSLTMKSGIVGALAGAVMLSLASAASATTFNWSYSGLNGYAVSASGTLQATPLGGGAYQVTSITGTRNGSAITGLTNYAIEDNQVYDTVPHLDFLGLAFNVGSDAFNIYFWDVTTGQYSCGAIGYCEIGPGVSGTDGLGPPADPTHQIDVSLSAVPEPSTWGMMLIGFGVLGAALRRRSGSPALV